MHLTSGICHFVCGGSASKAPTPPASDCGVTFQWVSMGKYSESISKRFEHAKITVGFCLICGKHGRLSQDHVPPKGAITITKIEQRHIVEMVGVKATRVKGVTSPNGSKFKTICKECNNRHLGGNDDEVARVCKSITEKVKEYFKFSNPPYSIVHTKVNAKKFARAMVGHILAATSVEECKKEPEESSYMQPLKDFVLGNDTAIENSHDIYYWFYPFNKHLSAKCVSFSNDGDKALVSLLSFFPLAFMVTKKNEGIYPAHSHQLSLTDEILSLDLSSRGFEYAEFPFHGLKPNQMMSLYDFQAIVSYPIGQ